MAVQQEHLELTRNTEQRKHACSCTAVWLPLRPRTKVGMYAPTRTRGRGSTDGEGGRTTRNPQQKKEVTKTTSPSQQQTSPIQQRHHNTSDVGNKQPDPATTLQPRRRHAPHPDQSAGQTKPAEILTQPPARARQVPPKASKQHSDARQATLKPLRAKDEPLKANKHNTFS